jgi:hypothetical protein
MLPGDMNIFVNLIKRDWSFPALVLSIFGLALTQWFEFTYPLVLGLGLTLFSAWDVIGYESVARSDKRENMVRYRIGQTSVQLLTIILLGVITGWNAWVVLGFIYLWWMGVCDVLFYILLGRLRAMVEYGDMFWLWWTPVGMMNRWMGRPTRGIVIFHNSLYAVIIWYAMWFLFPIIRLKELF